MNGLAGEFHWFLNNLGGIVKKTNRKLPKLDPKVQEPLLSFSRYLIGKCHHCEHGRAINATTSRPRKVLRTWVRLAI